MATIRIKLKDPDVAYEAIVEQVNQELEESNLPEDEQEAVRELRIEKYQEKVDTFFEYGEYLTVDIDTDKVEARVVPVREMES